MEETKMKNQQTFSDMEYANRKRVTKREVFLNMMDEIVPWLEWVELIRPFYPKGERGRPPRKIELMLRMYLLQNWFNLSDEMVEDAAYDSYAMRCFLKLDFFEEQVPDATTLLKFRHLIEKHEIGKKFFHVLNEMLEAKGCMMRGGTIVDATILNAPSSTKNASGERDPEMHSTKKGNQWYFGMKAHIGVDAGSGYTHTVEVTAANEHDVTKASALIREDDEVVYGDAGYRGIEKREEIRTDSGKSKIEYRINERAGKVKQLPKGVSREVEQERERRKSSVRSKVEHPFRIVKVLFGYSKAVYRGLSKNLNRLYVLFGSANLLMWGWAGCPER
jgi:IS5 family transposase